MRTDVPRLRLREVPGVVPRLDFAPPDLELRRLEQSRRIHMQVRAAKLEAIGRLAARYKDAVAFIRQQRPSETVEAFGAENAATLDAERLIDLAGHLERLVERVEDRADALEAQAQAAREAARTPEQRLEERLARLEADNRALRARLDARQAPGPAPAVEPPPLLGVRMGQGFARRGVGEPDAAPVDSIGSTRVLAEDR